MTRLLGSLTAGLASGLNLAADLCVLTAALIAGATLSGLAPLPADSGPLWLLLAAMGTWLVVTASLRHYDPVAYERQPMDDAALVSVPVLALATLLAALHQFAPRLSGLPRVAPFLLVAWPAALLLRAFFRSMGEREQDPLDDVLVVGAGAMARHTARDLGARRRRRVVGVLPLDGDSALDLEKALRTTPVGEVYLAADALRHGAQIQACIRICEQLGVPFALPAYCFRLERARPADSRSLADGYLHYLSIDWKPHQLALKRLFDIVSSGVALWLLSPLLIAAALAIKLTSRGPIFFKQVRVGLHGRPFHMLKFRSMVVNAEALREKLAAQNEMDGPVFKMKHDPRVTAIGRLIRKYSIDELPQLLNVLRGEMSIVGPRPPLPHEVAKYQAWQLRRLSVRPGLTCIWQVSGRNQLSFEEWMYLDLRYIDHWNLMKDLALIARTVPVVLTGRGAS